MGDTREEGMERYKAVVVGGGLAGLAAARMLAEHFGREEVLVVEAASSLGGRVKHVVGIVPWPVEVGPEFMHGTKNSSIKRIADEMGCQMRELPYHILLHSGREQRMLTSAEAEDDKDIQLVHGLFQGIASEDPNAPDISVAEYLRRKGANHIVTQFALSIYANDFGCSLEKLGMRECIQESQQWIYGDSYLILDRPLSCIIDHLSRQLKVRLDWPVKRVEYTKRGGVKVQSSDGSMVIADYLIVTVPVRILQQGFITFDPPLPSRKLNAIDSIGMNNALKVILAFSERFWPEDLFDVVCTDSFLPEIWITQYPPVFNQPNTKPPLGQFVVVGFMAGELAMAASKLPEAEIFRRSVSQLDDMFKNQPTCATKNSSSSLPDQENALGDQLSAAAEMPQKIFTRDDLPFIANVPQTAISGTASACFQGGCIVNWEDEAFIRGGYTFPSIKAHGARTSLAEHVIGRVFFAGEATHPGVNPCMQAAIDTGHRAATEILNLISDSKL